MIWGKTHNFWKHPLGQIDYKLQGRAKTKPLPGSGFFRVVTEHLAQVMKSWSKHTIYAMRSNTTYWPSQAHCSLANKVAAMFPAPRWSTCLYAEGYSFGMGLGTQVFVTMWPQYQHEFQSLYPAPLPYHHDHHYIDYIHCCAIPFQLYLNVQPLDRPSGQRLRKAQISGRWALAFFRTKSAASSEKQVGSSKMDNEWVVSTVLVFSCIYWFLHLFNSISVSCLPIYLSVHSTDLLVCLSIYLIIYCISMRFWCIHQFICLNIHFWHRFVDRERERRGENRISYVKMPSSVSARSDRQTHLVEDLPCKMLHTKEADWQVMGWSEVEGPTYWQQINGEVYKYPMRPMILTVFDQSQLVQDLIDHLPDHQRNVTAITITNLHHTSQKPCICWTPVFANLTSSNSQSLSCDTLPSNHHWRGNHPNWKCGP